MAHTQTVLETRNLTEIVLAPFKAFGGLLVRMSESNVRVKQLQHLSEMSDKELAARGLTRDEIVRHVYRGCL